MSPLATYWMPSSIPAVVAAAFRPPKSIEAVPDNIPCTPKMNMHENPTRKAAAPGLGA